MAMAQNTLVEQILIENINIDITCKLPGDLNSTISKFKKSSALQTLDASRKRDHFSQLPIM